MNASTLSIENCHDWSWACTFTKILEHLPSFAGMDRVVKDVKNNIPAGCLDNRKLFIFQNVDSLFLLASEFAKRIVVRIGGIAMQGVSMDDCVKYDENLQKVGAIVSTNHTLHELAKRNNENSFLIPNGVDLRKFKPIDRLRTNRFVVGFAGNIGTAFAMRYKGYPFIAGALTQLCLDVDLVTALYGHSQIAHDEMVTDFYGKIDCLINASEGEGCSNVVMEALACGIPVLLTKVGYHGEMLTHDENCIFIERDIENIKSAILRLSGDIALQERLRAKGREFAMAHHDIHVIAQQYKQVFETVLNNQ